MYSLKKVFINDISILILHKQESSSKLLPVIFLFHKLLQNKTNELPVAFALAESGYCVVIVDMVSHGERRLKRNTLEYNFNHLFEDIYLTAKDVRIIIEYLHKNFGNRLNFESITAIGVSIGASIALVSSCLISNVTRVACLVGSVNWDFMLTHNMLNTFTIFYPANSKLDIEKLERDRKRYEPFIKLKTNNFPSIIFINGLLDNSLLLKASRNYYKQLVKIYDDFGERKKLSFLELKKTGHEVNDVMIEHLLQWLEVNDLN